eukprot:2308180-Prymnesium_polylepis.2
MSSPDRHTTSEFPTETTTGQVANSDVCTVRHVPIPGCRYAYTGNKLDLPVASCECSNARNVPPQSTGTPNVSGTVEITVCTTSSGGGTAGGGGEGGGGVGGGGDGGGDTGG